MSKAKDKKEKTKDEVLTQTLLNLAKCGKHAELKEFLLANEKLDLNLKSGVGYFSGLITALTVTALCSHRECLDILVNLDPSRGLDLNAVDKRGRTAFMIVSMEATKKTCECLQILLNLDISRNLAVDLQDEDGNTALHLAAKRDIDYINGGYFPFYSGCLDLIVDLSDRGLLMNTQNKAGHTPLMVAVLACNLEAVEYFLALDPSKGVELNTQDKDGRTLLMLICTFLDLDEDEDLDEEDDLDKEEDGLGSTNSNNGPEKIMTALLNYKSVHFPPNTSNAATSPWPPPCSELPLNAQDKDGNTVLMIAAHRGYTSLVKLLLDLEPARKLDLFLTNNLGQTAWDTAQEDVKNGESYEESIDNCGVGGTMDYLEKNTKRRIAKQACASLLQSAQVLAQCSNNKQALDQAEQDTKLAEHSVRLTRHTSKLSEHDIELVRQEGIMRNNREEMAALSDRLIGQNAEAFMAEHKKWSGDADAALQTAKVALQSAQDTLDLSKNVLPIIERLAAHDAKSMGQDAIIAKNVIDLAAHSKELTEQDANLTDQCTKLLVHDTALLAQDVKLAEYSTRLTQLTQEHMKVIEHNAKLTEQIARLRAEMDAMSDRVSKQSGQILVSEQRIHQLLEEQQQQQQQQHQCCIIS